MTTKVIVETDKAPKAIGPYSQAVGFNGLLFCSGQIAIDPETDEIIDGGVEAQTARVMANLSAVLDARGLDFSHVIRTTIYLKNMTDFDKVNDIYGRFFDSNPPARATVEVSRLPKDVLVEIDMIAAVPEPKKEQGDDTEE
ncbi:RidA family protein [Persicimonas caeni]|jgi:2-iminobutanoate/2-iminopropanoate deaminase|uniref:RidA family protein n=1 Tax=Persicimonas caeni TaxID=2292766 RepID=A0A4Y6Q2G2_PERCE|nr:RidA family protein [Persicimonas caeni]QDG54185.1 RidA family protein [Persicimonas caeni]QED35406.1 RidA family protein [Persicimonas caeni]